ncbi:MAG: hypothetical protein JJU11_07880 [Candidatus Sumerlaeia bacterium]|nr:hypothetical protein [Candidatus Sumerlaeia bacterium]
MPYPPHGIILTKSRGGSVPTASPQPYRKRTHPTVHLTGKPITIMAGMALFLAMSMTSDAWTPATETVLGKVTETRIKDTSIGIRFEVPIGATEAPVMAIPVGNGKLSLEFRKASISSNRDGRIISLEELSGERREAFLTMARRHFSLHEFGFLRRIRVARLQGRSTPTVHFENEPWQWNSLEVEVHWEENPTGARQDPHVYSGPWRMLMENLLVAPDAIDALLQEPPEITSDGPTEWQPGLHGEPLARFLVEEDGLLAIDGSWLSDTGHAPESLDPERVALFTDGREVPTSLIGPEGRGFHQGRRLVFMGYENASPESRGQAYFLELLPEGQTAARMMAGPDFEEDLPEIIQHMARSTVDLEDEFKTRMGSFLSVREMSWVGAAIQPEESLSISIDLPALIRRDDSAQANLVFDFYLAQERNSQIPVTIGFAGEEITEAVLTSGNTSIPVAIEVSKLRESGNTFTVYHNGDPDTPSSRSSIHVDRVNLEWPAMLEPRSGRLLYTDGNTEESESIPHVLRTIGLNPARTIAVDITERDSPKLLQTRRDRANMLAVAELAPRTNLVLQDTVTINTAPGGQHVDWMDLANPTEPTDILVIYHEKFEEAAGLLEEDLRGAGYSTRRINTDHVYNAFSHGNLSSNSIRSFLSHAVYQWDHPPLGAILIGDGNSDGRNISRNDIPNLLPVPLLSVTRRGDAGESYSSDTFYTWLNEGDELADLLLGRIPASTLEDALATVHNIRVYRESENTPAPWANNILTVTDTGNFQENMERMDDTNVSRSFTTNFIFADDHPWEDNYYLPAHLLAREEDSKVSPLITTAITQGFNEGAGVTTFLGHGAPNLWSNQRFWFGGGTPNSDILNLENAGRLSFVTSFTCNNAVVDYPLPPWNVSIAQDFLRHKDKGAIACFMPSGPGYLRDHNVMGACFFRALTILNIRNQGVLSELARLGHQFHRDQDDQARMFLFLGDPTLSIPPPLETAAPPPRKKRENMFLQTGENSLIRSAGLHLIDGEESSRSRRLFTIIENSLQEEWETSWELRLIDGEGTTHKTLGGTLSIPPLSGAPLTVEFTTPGPGWWYVELELPHESAKWYRDTLPSRLYKNSFYLESSGGEGLGVIPASLEIHPHTSSTNPRRISMTVLNAGDATSSGTLEVILRTGGDDPRSQSTNFGNISPGRSQQLSQTYPLDAIVDEEILVTARILGRTGDPPPVFNERHWIVRPEQLPDLAIVPGSVTVSPRPLSDGLTAFVTATVTNLGSRRSPTVSMGLYAEDDSEFETPLRDMTRRRNLRTLDPLNPGEKRQIRLRWDPYQNAGQYHIILALDPHGSLIEANKENNLARVPLRVNTKWDLLAGDIRMARGDEPRKLLLLAQVVNRGQSPARRVSVNFFSQQDQTDSNHLGEVLLEEVPGESAELAVFEWEPSREILENPDFNPSFSIALKGSQRRVSSAGSGD